MYDESIGESKLLNKIVSGTALMLLLMGIVTLAFDVPPAKAWTGTVYIRDDGSIDPSDAPITTYDNVTYTLTDNITSPGGDGIVVERDNTIIDGKGFTVEGWRVYPPKGIYLSNRVNVTIQNMRIKGFCYGIYLNYSSNNKIVRNNLTDALYTGIVIWESSNYNSIVGNNITENDYDGIYLANSSNNSISGNSIANNGYSIYIWGVSSNNTIYHNNFINTGPAVDPLEYTNKWDDGYPSGGNYWRDDNWYKYMFVDEKSGHYQDYPRSDGICDTPLFPDPSDTEDSDNYPLMGPINIFEAGTWNETEYFVDVVSNSTITNFNFNPLNNPPTLSFDVEGQDGTVGFVRIAIPKDIMWCGNPSEWIIIVGGVPTPATNVTETTDCTYIYFTYTHSTKTVQIQSTYAIPEFPTNLILSVFIATTLVAAILYRKKQKTKFETI
jgi:parallel beta-helix repeat protein